MKLPPDIWKRIRSEAFKQSGIIANDIKEAMKISSATPTNTDEW
jgi:hypothetical protein